MDPLLLNLLTEIRDELRKLNLKLSLMQGNGTWSICDLYDKVDDVRTTTRDIGADICDRISDIGCGYDLNDVVKALGEIDVSISMK